MWAEWYRGLAELGVPPLKQMPRDVVRFRVDSIMVADLRAQRHLAAAGLPMSAPGRRTWPAFQRLGERLWREGWPGLMAPSAARPDGRVLCLFVIAGLDAIVRPIMPSTVVWEPPAPPRGMRT
jgi:RES domain